VILLLLIPFLLFTTNIVSLFDNTGDENVVFAGSSESLNSSINNDTMKTNFYLNFEFKEGVNKNISVQRVSENETNILVNDI
jgi:inner membrane protein